MANSGGIITAPINVETDVYRVLGIGPTSNGYDIGHACKHEKVNKWSKWKPIEWNKWSEVTDAEYAEASYGIISPAGDRYPNVAVEQGYSYRKPSTYFRLTDFNKYYHNAAVPCPPQNNMTVNTFWGTDATFVPNIGSASSNYSLDIFNFFWLKDCYPAIVFRITSGNTVTTYYRTADHKIGDKSAGEWNVLWGYNEPPFNDSRTVINNAFWVACTLPHPKGSSDPTSQFFYPLPYNNPSDAKFNIVIERGSPIIISVLGLKQDAIGSDYAPIEEYEGTGAYYTLTKNGSLYFMVDIQNKTSSTVALNVSNFKFSATKSFAQGYVGQSTGNVVPELYRFTTDWESVTSWILPPNSRDMYLVGKKNFMAYHNGVQYSIGSGSLTNVYASLVYNLTPMMNTPPVNYRI